MLKKTYILQILADVPLGQVCQVHWNFLYSYCVFCFVLFHFYLYVLLLRNVRTEISYYDLWICLYLLKVLSIFNLS